MSIAVWTVRTPRKYIGYKLPQFFWRVHQQCVSKIKVFIPFLIQQLFQEIKPQEITGKIGKYRYSKLLSWHCLYVKKISLYILNIHHLW